MDIPKMIIICSSLLFCSTGTYADEYFSIIHFLIKVGFWTKLLLILSFLAVVLISGICFLYFKYPLFSLKFIPLICFPWTVSLVFDEIRSHKHDLQSLLLIIVPAMIMGLLSITLSVKTFPYFSNHYENTLLTLQNKTNLSEVLRLLVCSCTSMWIHDFYFYCILGFLNIIVVFQKIRNITYANPSLQYTQLLMQSWSIVSFFLVILFPEGPESQIIFESLFIILAYFCIYPNEKIVTFFQMRTEWILDRQKRSHSEEAQVILVYYISEIYSFKQKVNNSFSKMLSPSFIYHILSQMKPNKSEQSLTDQSQRKIIEKYRFQEYFNDQQNSVSDMIEQFLKRKKTLNKCLNSDEIQLVILLYGLLIKNKLLSSHDIYKLSKHTFRHRSLFKKVSLQTCFKQVIRAAKKIKGVSFSQNDELMSLEKIEELLQRFSENQLRKVFINEHLSCREIKHFLEKRLQIRKQIQQERRQLSAKNSSCQKLVFFDYFIEKFINSNPRTAQRSLRKNLQEKINTNNTSIANCENKEALFVSTLFQQSMDVVHCNLKFKNIFGYSEGKNPQVHSILPFIFRSLHQEACKDLIKNDSINLHEHLSEHCFFQPLESEQVHPGVIQLAFYTGFEKEIFILGKCQIKQEEKVRIRKYNSKEDTDFQQIFGKKFVILPYFEKTQSVIPTQDKAEIILRKELNEKKYDAWLIEAEAKKQTINPFKNSFLVYTRTFCITKIAIILAVFLANSNLLATMQTNSRMNNIQNQLYRYVVFNQIYFPTVLCNFKLSSLYLEEEELEAETKKIIEEIEFIESEYQNFLTDIINYAEQDADIIGDLFETFPKKVHIRFSKNQNYFWSLFHEINLELQSMVHNFIDHKDPYFRLNFILNSLQLLHVIQQKDIFQLASIRINESKNIRLTYYYAGYYFAVCLISGFIAINLLWHIWASQNLQKFLWKFQLSHKLEQQFTSRAIQLRNSLSSLRRNRYSGEQTLKSSKYKIKKTQYLPNNKDKFYDQKPLLIGACLLLFIYVLMTFRLKSKAYSEMAFNLEAISESKLAITRFLADEVHTIEEKGIKILNDKGVWPELFFEDQLNEVTDEVSGLQFSDTIQILKNFISGHEDLKVTENPCESLIDCSEIQKKMGEKIDGLIVTKNKIYILMRQIQMLHASNSTYNQVFSTTDEVQEVLKQSKKMAYVINQLFKHDTELNAREIWLAYIKITEIYLLMSAMFIIIIIWYLKLAFTYHKYRKEIYMLLPVQQLILDQQFSPQINRLITESCF